MLDVVLVQGTQKEIENLHNFIAQQSFDIKNCLALHMSKCFSESFFRLVDSNKVLALFCSAIRRALLCKIYDLVDVDDTLKSLR